MYVPKWNPVTSTFLYPTISLSKRTDETTVSASPADKLAEALKNSCQNIHFDFIDFKNDAQIKEYTTSHRGMSNVVISKSLLEKIASDKVLLGKAKMLWISLPNLSTAQ